MTDLDPLEPVEVIEWRVGRTTGGWRLTTRGQTLGGRGFQAVKDYDTLDKLLSVIRETAAPDEP